MSFSYFKITMFFSLSIILLTFCSSPLFWFTTLNKCSKFSGFSCYCSYKKLWLRKSSRYFMGLVCLEKFGDLILTVDPWQALWSSLSVRVCTPMLISSILGLAWVCRDFGRKPLVLSFGLLNSGSISRCILYPEDFFSELFRIGESFLSESFVYSFFEHF